MNKPEPAAGLGYLGTVRKDGGPRIHPISPVLSDESLYAFILKASPKRQDLLRNGRYALHSFPHGSLYTEKFFRDEEFYLSGTATIVRGEGIHETVAKAAGDPADAGSTFELGLEIALHKYREKGRVVYDKRSSDASA